MKLVRIGDDRFVLDVGERPPEFVHMVSEHWKAWWAENPGEIPRAFVIGGMEHLIEYEDRREPDIESRLRALEAHTHRVIVDEDLRRVTAPPDGLHR